VERGFPPVEQLELLPENHRRVLAAALPLIQAALEELVKAGKVRASEADLQQLAAYVQALRPAQARNLEAVRAFLLVQLDDLEPQRLSGYGPLSQEQATILHDLVAHLRHLASSR
jgi:hypothetical protein